MTIDQIDNLESWLARNENFSLSIGTWGKKKFLRIRAIESSNDDIEIMYIPLNDISYRTKEEIN